MNKADLVEEVSNQTGLTKRAPREAIDAMTSVITDALARQEKVTLVGFQTFQVTERKARRGVSPGQKKVLTFYQRKFLSSCHGKI